MKLSCSCFMMMLAFCTVTGCAQDRATIVRAATASTQPAGRQYHIHLPGIGGYRGIDRGMLRGLAEGGYQPVVRAHDWTGRDAGLAALVATQRHKDESAKVARMILDELAAHPDSRITVTTHSAGAGIIAWALEQLPDDVQIDTLVLLSPALSPQYDLTRALAHVRGKAYVIYSPYDGPVLGIGTQMFGTVDGVKVEASGKVGFKRPPRGDERQYAKLVQMSYSSDWIKLGNIGDHIGSMARPFAREVIAPLLISGALPTTKPSEPLAVPPPLPAATTAPVTLPSTAEAPR
jgi:pimeloyl-ACP methyl ester carboxylesterase